MTWRKYIQIVVDHTKIDSDLTDFPLMINLSTVSGINSLRATSFKRHSR